MWLFVLTAGCLLPRDTADTAAETVTTAPAPCAASADRPVTVCMVDETGAPVAAGAAYWYRAPKGPSYDGEHPLVCVDAGCTVWGTDDPAVTGDLYVAATREGPPHADPYCGFSAYDASPVTVPVGAGGFEPQLVVLVLELSEWCA